MNPNEQKPGAEKEAVISPEEKERQDRLAAELKQIMSEAYRKDGLGTHEKILKESDLLTEHYGTNALYESRLYHVMIGSSEAGTIFDVDGKIEAFIRGLSEGEGRDKD